jgi:hypothetical protein
MFLLFVFEYEPCFGVGCLAAGSPARWKLAILRLELLASGSNSQLNSDFAIVFTGNVVVAEERRPEH